MKNILFTVLVIIQISRLFGQITLEHTYTYTKPSAYSNDRYGVNKICKLSNGNQYYCYSDSNKLYMYNLNHTLYKSFTLPNITFTGNLSNIDYDVWYISDKLFNLDNKIEYLVKIKYQTSGTGGTYQSIIKIINEDGTELFSKDNADITEEIDFVPGGIFNTINGTKMLIWNLDPNIIGRHLNFSIYSLPGDLVTSINNKLIPETKSYLSNPFPNPANEYAAVFYKLPELKKQGNIIIYDINGKQVQNIKIDGTNEYILFNNTNLNNGTYFYSLIVDNEILDSKKMIITR